MTVLLDDKDAIETRADILSLELWMAISGLELLEQDRELTTRRRNALDLLSARFRNAVLPHGVSLGQVQDGHAFGADPRTSVDPDPVWRIIVDIKSLLEDCNSDWENLEATQRAKLLDELRLFADQVAHNATPCQSLFTVEPF